MTRFERHYRKVSRRLSRIELTTNRNTDDRCDDAISLLYDRDGDRRFLDFYGLDGLDTAFRAYGLYDALERRGYRNPRPHFRVDDDRHVLFIEAEHDALTSPARLLELALRTDRLRASPPSGLPPVEASYEVLTVDWLHLCNPVGRFTRERPRLPGQEHPGLGVGEQVLELLYRVIARLDLDAVVTVGEYFHNAWLYAREMPLFDPHFAGQLRALGHLLLAEHRLSLAEASWAVECDAVELDGAHFRWRGELQMRPRAESLRSYLESPAWHAHAARAQERCRFRLRIDRWDAVRNALPLDPDSTTP